MRVRFHAVHEFLDELAQDAHAAVANERHFG